ncbi:GNAT family N-acetyltransferase [Nocardioides solisilvae]|uniref:GNAT family N-acetyltransferase n=1 Tax=Nocardioides solisilvae TaxID=1542435 RepID=UPI000D745731|nr:GNAT family N-acetyltransferase [Nocardioides solisilvae]
MDLTGLPEGLTARPLTTADASAVHEAIAAQELVDLGSVEIEEADIVSDWAKPSHDVPSSSVGVFDGDLLVGYAEVMGADRGDAAVRPSHRGRGIGTWLAHRMQEIARARGSRVVGMPVPVGSPGDRLLEQLGYRVRWHSWVLELPPGAEVAPRPLPDGYALSVATPEQHREVWTVVEDAFLEWSERDRESWEDFHASVVGRPGFEPWHVRVVTGPDGAVVGTAVLSMYEQAVFISRLAVARAERGRGLAQALLVDAFGAGRAHGATKSELSTDSRTGALSLYEKVGMVVRDSWVNRCIDLD